MLTVNAGSSTLKLAVIAENDEVLESHTVDPWDGAADPSAILALRETVRSADAVGHRVVHGGTLLTAPVMIDDEVLREIEGLQTLAPLHQPRSVAAIRAVLAALPDTPAVACFDTAHHATLAPAAATYALPQEWRERWPLRRFGFHGLSHQYAVRRAGELVNRPPEGHRVVTCHLGAGASLCASRDGRSVDTTMGFTPLEGLVMATRAGSVDPGLVLWLLSEAGLGVVEVTDALERSSGLAGLSVTSGDMRDVLAAARAGKREAWLALSVYLHRLRREIGAMAAVLGGMDTLVFTGGVGEHQPLIREAAAAGLGFLGVQVDKARNNGTFADGEISAAGAPARTLVVTAREDLEIARQVRAALG